MIVHFFFSRCVRIIFFSLLLLLRSRSFSVSFHRTRVHFTRIEMRRAAKWNWMLTVFWNFYVLSIVKYQFENCIQTTILGVLRHEIDEQKLCVNLILLAFIEWKMRNNGIDYIFSHTQRERNWVHVGSTQMVIWGSSMKDCFFLIFLLKLNFYWRSKCAS